MELTTKSILGALVAILATLLAVAASFIAADNKDQSFTSKLYCVPSSFSITTLDTALPIAQCFRVKNGTFSEVLAELPEVDTEEPVLLDGFILPGIIESHGHILQYGEMLESVSLYGARSVEEMRMKIKNFLKRHPGEDYGSRSKWIRGIGWDQNVLNGEGIMPTARELGDDQELAELYILLDRVDVHCVLTSQRILDLLPDKLPDIPGGVVISDPGPGVFCDNAMDAIIYPLAPKPDIAQKARWFKTAMVELNKVGIIGVGDAGMKPDDVGILESMAERGELSIRVNVMLECSERNTYCPEEIKGLKLLDSLEDIGSKNPSRPVDSQPQVYLGGVKLFADGALGSWGAALLEPYSDKETSGTMLINETELTDVVKDWFDAGFQVNVHAIGDRANRAVINAFQSVLGFGCERCNEKRRLRIEHAQIIHPDDQERIKKMGIIPSIQPTHATSDMAYALSRLGAERLSHSAYRMSSLFPSHNSSSSSRYLGPVLGSDFPVEPPHPFQGMYSAVTRLNPVTGTSPSGDGKGWYTGECLSVEQALLGFTKNAAYGWFKEEIAGTIEEGKWADWVVIDRDITHGSGRSLRDVKIKETWVGGRKVYPPEPTVKQNTWGGRIHEKLHSLLNSGMLLLSNRKVTREEL